MEALNLNLPSSQPRLFDMIHHPHPQHPGGHPGHGHGHNPGPQFGSGSGSATIEFMLRSFDHPEHNHLHPGQGHGQGQGQMVNPAFIFNPHPHPLNQHHQPSTLSASMSTSTPTSGSSSSPESAMSSTSTSTTHMSTSNSNATRHRNILPNPNTMSTSTSTSTSATLELDPNVILQNYVNENVNGGSEYGDSSPGEKGRPHLCDVCNANYKTRTHLRRHMMIHLQSRPYPCPDCGKGFNRKEHLSKHAEAVHSSLKFICPFCDKQISRKDHLARHIKNMHPTYAPFLNKEGFLSDQMSHLKKVSMAVATSPPSQKTKSTKRSKAPANKGSSSRTTAKAIQPQPQPPIRVPVMQLQGGNNLSPVRGGDKSAQNGKGGNPSGQEHQKGRGPVQQSQNGLILDNQTFQQNNIPHFEAIPGNSAVSGQTAPPTGSCAPVTNSHPSLLTSSPSKAGKTTPQTLNPNQNGLLGLTNLSMTLGGQIKQAPFANCSDPNKRTAGITLTFHCPECILVFTTEKDLSSHLRSHKPQNFRCAECPRAYTRREKLTEHVRCYHQGEKFRCEHCGKELSRKDHVLRHVRSIHPELLASRFSSVMTSGELPENIAMEQDEHGRLSFPSTTSTSTNNSGGSAPMNEMNGLLRSICQYCLKVFGTSYHLSRHIESCHNGDIRPYHCPSQSCSKMFKRKDHLTKHVKSHCPTLRDSAPTLTKDPRTTKSNNPGSTAKRKTNSTGREKQDKTKPKQSKIENEESQRKKGEDSLKSMQNSVPEQSSPSVEEPTGSEDFNLAMINSFMSSNVDVDSQADAGVNVDVVMGNEAAEREELSSLMLTQDLNTTTSRTTAGTRDNNSNDHNHAHHNLTPQTRSDPGHELRSIQFPNF